jgi:hypothetical protein
MTLSRQHALVAIMFLVPMFCCFVGAGAFVHVVLAVEEKERHKEDRRHREEAEQIVDRQRQCNELAEKIKSLQQKIAEISNRIRGLTERLLQAVTDDKTAGKIREDLAKQRALMAKMLAEFAELSDQIAQKQKAINSHRNETKAAQILDRQLKELRERLADLTKQVEEARKANVSLAETKRDLQREREEQERAVRILPRRRSVWNEQNPVYLDCAAGGAVLQPAGERLAAAPGDADRARFLAAVRKSGHVVFLIRPDGIFTFYQYRGVLTQETQVRLGWEPVDASWNLIYPKTGEQ